jgi:hypothetical protein
MLRVQVAQPECLTGSNGGCGPARGPGLAAKPVTDLDVVIAVAVFGISAQALMSLVAAKPELGPAVEHATGRPGGLGDIEQHFAAYLNAEQKLGRIGPAADTETLAFTLLGTVHHLILTRPADAPDLGQQVRRIVAALVAGMDPGAARYRAHRKSPDAAGRGCRTRYLSLIRWG